jgi:hypothetical protein
MNLAEFRCQYPLKPHQIVWRASTKEEMEVISYPFPENGGIFVMIRKRNDPTTLEQVNVTWLLTKKPSFFNIYFPHNWSDVFGVKIGKLYFDFYLMQGLWMYVNFHGWRNLQRYRLKLFPKWKFVPDKHNV